MTVGEKIFRCWNDGIGIGETRLAVLRVCGIKPGFEEVRRQFVDLSHRFAGAGR